MFNSPLTVWVSLIGLIARLSACTRVPALLPHCVTSVKDKHSLCPAVLDSESDISTCVVHEQRPCDQAGL